VAFGQSNNLKRRRKSPILCDQINQILSLYSLSNCHGTGVEVGERDGVMLLSYIGIVKGRSARRDNSDVKGLAMFSALQDLSQTEEKLMGVFANSV
jgi:hypothetical protein